MGSGAGHAKNPKGVLAEALTLSGFSTLLALQPRRAGLPARSRSHLSVTPSPIRSCLQVGFATIGVPSRKRQIEPLWKFRDLVMFFASQGMAIDGAGSNLRDMAEPDKVTELGRLLGAVASDHHEAHRAGPSPHWAEWYAARLQGELGPYVGFEPTVDEIAGWLREADERYRAENPDVRWPFYYAELILDSLAITDS